MRTRHPLAACLLLAAVAASACASVPALPALPFGPQSPRTADQLTVAAIRGLSASPSVHFQGGWIDAQNHQIQLGLTTTPHGEGQGSASVDGHAVDVLESGGRTFFRGPAFWAIADPGPARLYRNNWVATQPATLGGTVQVLTRPGAISDLLGTRRYALRLGPTDTINGQSVLTLLDSVGAIYVTADQPTHLVRLVTAQGYVRPDGIRDLHLDFEYPPKIDIQPPAFFIDPTDPHTMPARYVVVGTQPGRCDVAGCEQVVTLRNTAGSPSGQAVLTVRLASPAGATLGTCTAPVPAVAYNQTEDVRCTVSGQAWATYVRAPGASTKLQGKATVKNPPYDG